MQTKILATRVVLDPQELADRWDVHVNTIYNMLKSGQLRGFRARNSHRITIEEVEAVEKSPIRPAPEVKHG